MAESKTQKKRFRLTLDDSHKEESSVAAAVFLGDAESPMRAAHIDETLALMAASPTHAMNPDEFAEFVIQRGFSQGEASSLFEEMDPEGSGMVTQEAVQSVLRRQFEEFINSEKFQVQRRLVTETWAPVAPNKDEAIFAFYDHWFEQVPRMAALFERTSRQKQAMMFSSVLSMLVSGLDDVEMVIPKLHMLGRRHAMYKAPIDMFPSMGASLLWTIQQQLGEEAWTPEVESAWTDVYALVTKVMTSAQADAEAEAAAGASRALGSTPRFHPSVRGAGGVATPMKPGGQLKFMVKGQFIAFARGWGYDEAEAGELFDVADTTGKGRLSVAELQLAVEASVARFVASPAFVAQRDVVKSTWGQLAEEGEVEATIGLFYSKWVAASPGAARAFEGVDSDKQARMFSAMLGMFVEGLDDPDAVVGKLTALGKRHVGYGAPLEIFPTLGTALCAALQEKLGEARWTPETAGAWESVLALVSKVMLAAYREDSRAMGDFMLRQQ